MNPLTPYNHSVTLPQELLKTGGVIMTGVILCNKCRKKMNKVCSCGNSKCIVVVYWHGKHYHYRRDDQGYVLVYDRAVDKLIEIGNAIKKGVFIPVDFTDEKIKERKFEVQIEQWLNEKETREQAQELSPGTVRSYRGYVLNHYPILNAYDVREISLEQLSSLKDTLSGVSIKTRKNIMNALRNFFYWLKERGTIKNMPIFPHITGDNAKARTAIDCQLQTEVLKRIPENHRDPIEFLMETGLRPGEVCALLVEHIDVRQGIARIERTYVSGNTIRETTKQKRKRIIPLSDRALQIAEKNIKGKLPKQFLFINSRTGRGYYPKALWYQWTIHSGLDIDLYSGTRHSFATQLIQDNDISIVKELMGHSDIRTTEKYLHMRMSKMSKVVNLRTVEKPQKGNEIETSFEGDVVNDFK